MKPPQSLGLRKRIIKTAIRRGVSAHRSHECSRDVGDFRRDEYSAYPDQHERLPNIGGGDFESVAQLIPLPAGCRVWIATGHTDMRRGMQGLALQVQECLKRDPHGGDLFVFRGRRGDLAKILWHDGVGFSLYAKRLDRGVFIWPSASGGVVSISAAQMAYMLEGIDWRNPRMTWRPQSAG